MVGLSVSSPRPASAKLRSPVGYPLLSLPETSVPGFGRCEYLLLFMPNHRTRLIPVPNPNLFYFLASLRKLPTFAP